MNKPIGRKIMEVTHIISEDLRYHNNEFCLEKILAHVKESVLDQVIADYCLDEEIDHISLEGE